MSGYEYYSSATAALRADRKFDAALRLSHERATPSLNNPDYLILKNRARLLHRWVADSKETNLDILDVGGRLQPYRDFLDDRSHTYTAIDPQVEGLADVIATAERLPFRADSFHLVICAQVLSYVDDPFAAVAEMRRVLKPEGHLFLSVPAFCPQYHDERWRFLREGVERLLHDFAAFEICAEGYSVAGGMRMANKILDRTQSKVGRELTSRIVFRLFNWIGKTLDGRTGHSEFLTPNYSAWARK
jgi:SAM-dependent methyltransferase